MRKINRDVFFASNKEQTELLTDPFGLTILAHLDAKKDKSAEEVAAETGESLNLIKKYMEKMYRADMLEVNKDSERDSYLKKADYYRFPFKLLTEIPEQFQDHQIFGLLYALQGDFYDLLSEASEYGDLDAALKEAGYPPAEESLKLFLERIYVTPDELKELNQKLTEVIREYTKKPEDESDYLTLDLNFFTKPNLPEFRKKLNQ